MRPSECDFVYRATCGCLFLCKREEDARVLGKYKLCTHHLKDPPDAPLLLEEAISWATDATALRIGYQCKECMTAAFFNGSARTSDEDIRDYVERLRHEVEMVHQWVGDNCPSNHVDLAIPEDRLSHTGALLPRICCKAGCSARAVLFVGFLFRQRKGGPAAQTVMDLPICQMHAACPVATFLTDNVWRQVMAEFDRRGAARPNRRLTETFFTPIDEAPEQFRSKYEPA